MQTSSQFQARPALHMQNLGIRLLVMSYCCMGCALGQLARLLLVVRTHERLHEAFDLFPFIVLANFLGVSGLVLFFRRGIAEPAIGTVTKPVEILWRGGAANNRMAFFLCTTAWVIGLLLGEIFSK